MVREKPMTMPSSVPKMIARISPTTVRQSVCQPMTRNSSQ